MSLPYRATRLHLVPLELRDVPAALQIVFDYRYDATGFFNDATKRGTLERAGGDIAARLNQSVDLAAISPGGSNSWTASFFNPSNSGQQLTLSNLSVGTDQIVVFVGADQLDGSEAGEGGYGGFSASGSQSWLDRVRSRGRTGFASWGGSLSLDSDTNWHTGTGTPGGNQLDMYSVITHELGHVLGFGVANQWNSLVSGNRFVGANATRVNGGTAPRLADAGHYAQDLESNGQTVSMAPSISTGVRRSFTDLDYAALADLGWEVSGINSGSSNPPVNTSTTTTTVSSPILAGIVDPIILSGGSGTFQVYQLVGGQLQAVGSAVTPYPGFPGAVRTATGDVNGDGVKDIITAAGPGGAPHVKIFDGRTGLETQSFFAYETGFVGGVFVASGDFDRDGRDDVVVGPDVTGGPRVRIFSAGNPDAVLADFLGIDDRSFTGGVRVSVGDINRDGRVELVAAAGYGGAPRVAIWNGSTIGGGSTPQRLVGDFFGYETTLPNGSYVAVGDVNADGYGDVILGAGPGAGARVKVLSGRTLVQQGSEYAVANLLSDYFVDESANNTGGVRVNTGDYNGDNQTDIAVGTGGGQTGVLYLNLGGGLTPYTPFGGSTLLDGIFVG